MYCSGCGQVLAPGQEFCHQCGRPAAAPVATVPGGLAFQLNSYAGKVRTLSIVWLIYAALSLVTGICGLAFAGTFFTGHFGPWMNGPWGDSLPPQWFGPAILRFVWVAIAVRAGLAAVAAWGLYEHAQWGRIVAIVAAVLCLLRFPLGTALGIWTLVVLLGYRNASLYEQL
jgi:hypothetical protein